MFAAKDLLLTRPSGGYVIPRSLRFRASATAYLNRTFGSPTSANKWTLSQWVKRGKFGANDNGLFHAGALSVSHYYEFTSGDALQFIDTGGGCTTTRLFRDPAAWYHIVLAVDAAASGSNKVRIYVNGVEETSFSADTRSTWTGGTFNANATAHYLGLAFSTTYVYDGEFAENIFVDGQQLTPSSFGAISNTTGVWSPIKYAGTYGANGFYLNFNSYATTAALGTDTSGNGNTWTVNNCSVTAGVTYDSMIDVPTVSATGSNYCVLNTTLGTSKGAGVISDGNLKVLVGGSHSIPTGTVATPASGKFYYEGTFINNGQPWGGFGMRQFADNGLTPNATGDYAAYDNGTNFILVQNGSTIATVAPQMVAGQVYQMCIDATNGNAWVGRDNLFWTAAGVRTTTSAQVAAGTSPTFTFTAGTPFFPYYDAVYSGWQANFGQQGFTYTPPTGYSALNTYNLPTPSILIGAAHMAATTYTGTGASLTVANTVNSTSFQPDFVWMKSRSAATDHALYDSVRGTTKDLVSDTTAAETTQATGLTAFGSTGFTVGALAKVNTSAATYIGWQWKGSGTTVSNTTGSITSTVCVNPTAGFSVVSYTGTGANATVGHGLGKAPGMIITKPRNSADNWISWHNNFSGLEYIYLNLTNAKASLAAVWNSTVPSSTVFSLGTNANSNSSGQTQVAYCFAPIAGYSAFGSYTGNGSADGPFIFTGFRPRYCLIKRTETAGFSWPEYDSARYPYNQASIPALWTDLASAEGSYATIDFLSNGFKVRDTSATINASGGTYIYAAFAESPFKNSLAR